MALPNAFGDNPGANSQPEGGDLVELVMGRVRHGRRVRDNNYAPRWKEYTRLWRGFFISADKSVPSERSQIIAPALQQAVEMTVAEIEEAVFSRGAWFDITDDILDDNKDDAVAYRDQLLEDFEMDQVPAAIAQCFLLGAVYGTGIAKLGVEKKKERSMVDGKERGYDRVALSVTPVRPDEFVIDPGATTIDEALYVAHEPIRPLHLVRDKQRDGIYRSATLDAWTGARADTDGTGKKSRVETEDNSVLITEYFGKVPSRLIPGSSGKGQVEAIVTIANETILLRAVASPFTMEDRPFVAYPHDVVPGEFWGRGVCEKGYNPQKALDAELRARIDTLALITSPMMGADITRLPRNTDTSVRPGKTLFTRGKPSEIYEPISFANPAILAHTFQHSGDLERMVQMGTGAMDSATPIGINSRNETASGMSQLQAGFIKRSKRTMQNIERLFIDPLVRKSLWRYMQFDPARYPVDLRFSVNATMGIMAKEVENTQLNNMLGYLQPEDPARKIVIQAIFENTASSNKKELKQAIELMNQPPDPAMVEMQNKMQELQLRAMTADVALKEAEVEEALAKAELARAKAKHELIVADLEDDLVDIQAANAVTGAQKVREERGKTNAQYDRNDVERTKAAAKQKKE